MISVSARRSFVFAIFVGTLLMGAAGPAAAAAGVTFTVNPRFPSKGMPAEMLAQLWATGLDGAPDLEAPIEDEYPFDVRIYTLDEFAKFGPITDRGFGVRLTRAGGNSWKGRFTLHEEGTWVIVLRNFYQPQLRENSNGQRGFLFIPVSAEGQGREGADRLTTDFPFLMRIILMFAVAVMSVQLFAGFMFERRSIDWKDLATKRKWLRVFTWPREPKPLRVIAGAYFVAAFIFAVFLINRGLMAGIGAVGGFVGAGIGLLIRAKVGRPRWASKAAVIAAVFFGLMGLGFALFPSPAQCGVPLISYFSRPALRTFCPFQGWRLVISAASIVTVGIVLGAAALDAARERDSKAAVD